MADDRCCDMHNAHCEPPSELCCGDCTEIHHGMHSCGDVSGLVAGSHHDGSACVLMTDQTPPLSEADASATPEERA